MTQVRELGGVTPIYFIGESHCIAFSGIFSVPGWSDVFQCRPRFLPDLTAEASTSAEGKLNDEVRRAFISEGLILEDGQPVHLAPVMRRSYPAFLEQQPIITPAVVLFAGDKDLVRLCKKLGDGYDFELPGDGVYGVDRSKTPIPFLDIQAELIRRLDPFVQAIDLLKRAGFNRLMVHALWPRVADTRLAANLHEDCPLPEKNVRAKLALMANRHLAESCRRLGVTFIDPGPESSQDGYLKPEFELDGVHVNRKAAAISLFKIIRTLFDETAGTHNPARYVRYAEFAEKRPVAESADTASWREHGVVAGGVIDAVDCDKATELVFSALRQNQHSRPDWVGSRSRADASVLVAEPDQVMLERATRWLGEGKGAELLHAGSEVEMTVTSFRPLRILASAPAPVAISDLPAPPRTRRAILFFSHGTFQLQSTANAALTTVNCEPGQIVVYDPKRWRCLAQPAGSDMTCAEICVIPRAPGAPFRVVWADLNDWPADPYIYSVAGLRAFPPFATDRVNVPPMGKSEAGSL